MSIINHYIEGQTVSMTARFTLDGVLTDPTTITLKVKDPEGTISEYTYALSQITKVSTGIYNKDIALNTPGLWIYRYIATGSVATVGERKIYANASQID